MGERILIHSLVGTEEYLIAQIGMCMICAVNVDDGNRWTEGTKVNRVNAITELEMDRISGHTHWSKMGE
jgi:hypothetical protein